MPLVFLLFALFASIFTIGKTALEYSTPFFLVGSRMCLAGIILILYTACTKPEQLKSLRKDWRPFVMLAIFAIYLTNTFEFWGLKYLTSFKTCFIYSLSPFLSALFSYLIFSEKMTQKKWLGLAVGCLGIAPILLDQSSDELQTGSLLFFSWAEIAVLLACISSVYGWILLKKVIQENNVTPIVANGVSMLIGGAMALVHSYAFEDWNPLPITEYVPFLECTLALILISNIICYNLYGHLLKKYSATFMSFAGFTTPIFAAFFGWFFLGEMISWEYYFSLSIIFVGLYIFNNEELKATQKAI